MAYSNNEYIKIFRKLLEWEWYTDGNTFRLFVHCLLKANWKAGSWKGQKYERGQFITSLPTLCEETGLTMRQARTALDKLKTTGEVTDKVTNKYRIITVKNYELYQGNDRQNDSQTTDKRQATRQTNDSSIRSKEDKNLRSNNSVVVSNNNKYIYKGEPTDTQQHTTTPTFDYSAVKPGTIPTIKQIRERCAELGVWTDVDAFVEYNIERKWKLPWPKALDKWLERDRPSPGKGRTKTETYRHFDYERKDTDYDDLQRRLKMATRERYAADG